MQRLGPRGRRRAPEHRGRERGHARDIERRHLVAGHTFAGPDIGIDDRDRAERTPRARERGNDARSTRILGELEHDHARVLARGSCDPIDPARERRARGQRCGRSSRTWCSKAGSTYVDHWIASWYKLEDCVQK